MIWKGNPLKYHYEGSKIGGIGLFFNFLMPWDLKEVI
jgi:hypothetical protein